MKTSRIHTGCYSLQGLIQGLADRRTLKTVGNERRKSPANNLKNTFVTP